MTSIKLSLNNSFDEEQTNTALMLKGEIDPKYQKKIAMTTNPKYTEDIKSQQTASQKDKAQAKP